MENKKQYPSFRPLEKCDKAVFDEAFKRYPPEISEFTFTNLYAWKEIYKLNVSILDSALILRSGANNKPGFFPPIGADVKKAAKIILETSNGVIFRTPESIKALFDKDRSYNIEFDLDNSDYLFGRKDLVSLAGKKYDGKRNLIKKFKSSNKYQYIKLGKENIGECLEFEGRWCSVKDCENIKGLRQERRAARQIIENFCEFNLIGGAIRINGKIMAIAIAEKLNPDTLVMHVLKACSGITGLYQVMNNDFLSLEASGFEYVNLEQDSGSEGLRKAKLSYHPQRMIKKYTITLK